MKRSFITSVLALALVAGAAGAQNPRRPRDNPPPPTNPPPDSAEAWAMPQGMGPGDPARAQMLRAQVEERFGRMVQTDLQISDGEMQRIRQAMRANQDRRIAIMRREQDLRLAIGRQMQPGVGADNDSLSRMLDATSHLRLERAQSDDQFVRELAFLPPVKRARLMFMMQRFEQRVQEIRRGSMERGMMGPRRPMQGRPGMPDRRPRD